MKQVQEALKGIGILKPGMNAISWSGEVTKVEVKPNWRYL